MATKHFSWGTGIAISLGLFMLLIVGFSVRMMMSSEKLTEEHPYERGLDYQQEIEIKNRSASLEQNIKIAYRSAEKDLRIIFPQNIRPEAGKVKLYRPSDGQKDVSYTLPALKGQETYIPISGLEKGRWIVKLDWTENGVQYSAEKNIHLP